MAENALLHAQPEKRRVGWDRMAGIDRDTVKPSLLVLALAALMSVVLPWVNDQAPYRHPVRRGDIAEVAGGITFAPTAGWDLASGALAGHTRSRLAGTGTTELVDGSVNFDVQAAPFTGTPAALLRRVDEISSKLHHARGSAGASPSYSVTTRQGAFGVAQDFVGASRAGSVVAFVFRVPGQPTAEGVEIVVSGPKAPLTRRRDEVVTMIRSIRVTS